MRWFLILALCGSAWASEQNEKEHAAALDKIKAESDAKVKVENARYQDKLKVELKAEMSKGEKCDLDLAKKLKDTIASLEPPKVEAKPSEIISKEWTYTTSSQHPKFPPSPKLLDGTGVAYGDKNDGYSFHTEDNNSSVPFIVIDCKGPHTISGFDIVNRITGMERTKTLTMLVGDTNQGPWFEVWRASSPAKNWSVKLDKPVPCQFIKIALRERGVMHLAEITFTGN